MASAALQRIVAVTRASNIIQCAPHALLDMACALVNICLGIRVPTKTRLAWQSVACTPLKFEVFRVKENLSDVLTRCLPRQS